MPQIKAMDVPTRLPLLIEPENRYASDNVDARLVNAYMETIGPQRYKIYKRPGLGNQVIVNNNATGMGMYTWNGNVYSIFSGLLQVPVQNAIVTHTTGGTLAAGTYFYVVTSTSTAGETTKSNEMSINTTGSASSNTISWVADGNLTHKVYRGTTSGGEGTYYTVATGNTFLDTGAAGTAGTPPGTNTALSGILYKNGAQVATGLDTSAGVYQFSSIMGATPKMVLNNGAYGYAYDDTALLSADLHSLSPSYPQYTVKGWAYLDGAQYVMQHFFGTSITPAVIWGSAINSVTQPTDWDPLDFITAQVEPDSGVCMAKQLVYVVALKQWSTEFFFDAGNATGSPLQSIPGSKSAIGCASQDSVQSIEDVLFWLSTNRSASRQIIMMERLQPHTISTKAIERLLNDIDISLVYSWQVKLNGHSFYVITFVNSNLTLAYDIKENMWSQWTDTNGNYVPICASTYDSAGHRIVQHATNGSLYYMDSIYLDDAGTVITVSIYTPNFDGGTGRRKQLNFMEVIGDQQPGSYMTIQTSDDDYQSWSSPRRVDMSQRRMFLTKCGTFTRRAWLIQHAQNTVFRIEAMDVQFDLGTL